MQQATPQEANILQRILQSPFAQKLVDEDNLAKKTAREKLIAELAELKRGAIDRAPGVRARHDVALKALEAAREALKKAQLEFAKVESSAAAASHTLQVGVRRIEKQLLSTADPSIDAFIKEMRELFDRTLNMPLEAHERRTGRRSLDTNKPETQTFSSHQSIANRLEAIREAMQAAERMKVEIAGPTEVAAQLEALRSSIPGTSTQLVN